MRGGPWAAARLVALDAAAAKLDAFAAAESADTGKPLALAKALDVPRAVANFRFFAGLVEHGELETTRHGGGLGRGGGGASPDAALNYTDKHGNATYLGPDPYFDDLFCMAADRAYVSVEQVIDTAGLTVDTPVQRLLLSRMMVSGVVETPNGAHFTTCTPDYERDEKFQKAYVAAASGSDEEWAAFEQRFLAGDEDAYQAAVLAFAQEEEK